MTRGLRGTNLALLLFLGSLWGTAFMFISLGLESFSPILFAALRFDVSGIVLLAVAAARARGPLLPRGGRQWAAVGFAALFNVAAYHALLFWGQQFTTAGIAAVIVGLNPVLTTVFSRWLLEDDRVGVPGILGLGLGFAGIVLLVVLRTGNLGDALADAKGVGELVVVGAIASWALGSVLVKRTSHGMDVFAFIAWHSFAGAAVLHAAALFLEDGGRAVFDGPGILSLFYLAVISSGLGFIIYFTLIERVGPIRVNLVSHVAPVFATIAGFLVIGEAFEARALFAFLLIAAGFALVARPPAPAPPGASRDPPG